MADPKSSEQPSAQKNTADANVQASGGGGQSDKESKGGCGLLIFLAVLIFSPTIFIAIVLGSMGYFAGSNFGTGWIFGNKNTAAENGCTSSTLDQSILNKINQNKSIYQRAAQAEGIDWEMLAAVHYREGSNNPNQSLMSGEQIGTRNPDNGQTYLTLYDSAVAAARSLKSRVNGLRSGASDTTIKLAFLGHNRGNMYKAGGCSVDQSPYVMNKYDAAHQNMTWPNNECEPRSTRGRVDTKFGAFTIYAILKGRIAGNASCGQAPLVGAGSGSCTWRTVAATGMNSAAANTKVDNIPVWHLSGGTKVSAKTTVYVNQACTARVKEIFQQIYDSPDKPVINSVGCYANRHNNFSIHQYGAACDINSEENFCINCYAKKNNGCRGGSNVGSFWKPGALVPDKNYYGWSNGLSTLSVPINSSISKAFANAGWGRGLYHEQFGSCYNDFMHFSLYGGR